MVENIVYDFGLHKGEDTDFYLAKGFKVTAVEANPDLVEFCQNRFRDQILNGRLCIVHGAVTPDNSQGSVPFFANTRKSIWGTVEESWMERNEGLGASSRKIMVPTINLQDFFAEHGTPFYVKIDIEGADRLVPRAMMACSIRPEYLSIESEKVVFDDLIEEIDELCRLRFTRFQAVQQAFIPGSIINSKALDGSALTYRFVKHSSGPFGKDLQDKWLSRDEIIKVYEDIFKKYRYLGDRALIRKLTGRSFMPALEKVLRYPLPGWYDTHAAR
jgi:FkbM family methyltransferase